MFTFADGSGDIGNQALLYGANNSGKTNFLRAIEAMGSTVRFGLSRHLPFKLDSESANNPSVFEVLLLTKKMGYKPRPYRTALIIPNPSSKA